MNFRSSFCCVALMVVCMGSFVPTKAHAAGESFTMEQAVNMALQANPGLEAKMLLLEQARLNIGVAQSYFWPRVSVMSSSSRVANYEEVQTYNTDNLTSDNWTQGLRASWSIFAGFAHLNNLQKSRLTVEVEKARHQLARLELTSNVQLQFLNLLKCREDLKSATEAVSRIQKQLDAAEAFVKVGMAPYLNVLQNRTELSRAQQAVIRVNNDIRNAEVQLNKYLGFYPNQPVRYLGDLRSFAATVGYTEEEAVVTAVRQRPDLTVAKKSVEVAYKDMHITMGQFLPKVDATYDSLSTGKEYDNKAYKAYTRDYWTAGVNFSWELFSGGGAIFGSLADRKRAQSLQKTYEDAMSSARADVIRSLLDITAAKELIATSRKGVDAARESYEMANKRYMTNTGTITELLDAQLKLTQAETDASQALTEFQNARTRFFYHIGRENPGLI